MSEISIFYGKTIPDGYLLDIHFDYGACEGSVINCSGYWQTIKVADGH